VRAVPRDTAVGLAPGASAGVPVAPAPARPLRARVPRRLALIAAIVAVAGASAVGVVALTGSDSAERALPAGPVLLDGVSLQSANCTRWWAAGEAERTAAVHALSRSIGGPTPYGPGTTLPDARVQRLFDRVCAPAFASHFLLYEIYVRAAGFKSLGG
jgi:hypothetical protein